MKLLELAKHVNNLEGLSGFLRSEVAKRRNETVELNSKGASLIESGLDRDSKEVMEVTRKIMELSQEVQLLESYRKSILSLVNLDAQIPTRL